VNKSDKDSNSRRHFIGGSDARIVMGSDEAALVQLWREKRGEVDPEDLSGNLIVQLGVATEGLNRRWYAGGCQGGDRPWHSGQALKVGGGEL
jgi:predicted phage-related endonuclease